MGLALSSGGWRGLSYIGVIKELERMGVRIEAIAGSSAGALIGGMYAATRDIKRIEDDFKQLRYRDLLRIFSDPFAPTGLFRGQSAEKFLRDKIGKIRIEEMEIKFAGVGTDIFKGKPVVIRKGDLATVIRISGSLPFIFEPVEYKGMRLIDGGASLPIPVKVVREMGAEIVLAVNPYTNLFSTLKEGEKRLSRLETLKLSYYSVMSKLAAEDAKKADVVLEPQIKEGSFGIFRKFVNNMKVVGNGEGAVRVKEKEIRKVLG